MLACTIKESKAGRSKARKKAAAHKIWEIAPPRRTEFTSGGARKWAEALLALRRRRTESTGRRLANASASPLCSGAQRSLLPESRMMSMPPHHTLRVWCGWQQVAAGTDREQHGGEREPVYTVGKHAGRPDRPAQGEESQQQCVVVSVRPTSSSSSPRGRTQLRLRQAAYVSWRAVSMHGGSNSLPHHHHG